MRVYKWTLTKEANLSDRIIDKIPNGFKLPFVHKTLNGLFLTAEIGYSWDGASPKFKLGNKIIGTPDFGTKTYTATLWHDVFYQYSSEFSKFGITRKEVDDLFLKQLKEEKFKLAKLYYRAVRIFGWVNWN